MAENFEEYSGVSDLLRGWKKDPKNLREAFVELRDKLASKENTLITFRSRPGVSHSLRASVVVDDDVNSRLFALVDIVDDDPDNRWLSVCFYEDMISDDDQLGEFIPKGILGEDGYCFNLYDKEETMISYLKERIDEAHAKTLASG